MQKVGAFFKLIRWQNLLMIVLVQLLLQYMLIGHVFRLINMDLPLNNLYFSLLMLSTIFMAAFGYVYNDVMDIQTDMLNKDNKRIIGVHFSKTTGLRIAWTLLALAIIPAIYLSIALQLIQLVFIHIIIALGLYYYSKDLQKRVLSGNILISLFTAMSIFIVWLYHLVVLKNDPIMMVDARRVTPFINQLVIAFTSFAFLISLIRELIKDVEDRKGDGQKNYKTFAVVYGVKKSKRLVCFFSIIMLISVLYSVYYTYLHHWLQLSTYLIVAVAFPLVYFMVYLQKSKKNEEFSDLSILAKIIMVAGILSMQIFYINY